MMDTQSSSNPVGGEIFDYENVHPNKCSHPLATITKWADDPILASALTTSTIENEVSTDYRVISHLLNCGSISLDQTKEELNVQLEEVVRCSSKSAIRADMHIVEADKSWLKGDYQIAYGHYLEVYQ